MRPGPDDAATLRLLAPLDHAPTRATTLAERAFLGRLEGGCQVPMAAYAELKNGQAQEPFSILNSQFSISLQGLVGALDGSQVVQGARTGGVGDAETLGVALAEDLLARGAAALLKNEG